LAFKKSFVFTAKLTRTMFIFENQYRGGVRFNVAFNFFMLRCVCFSVKVYMKELVNDLLKYTAFVPWLLPCAYPTRKSW